MEISGDGTRAISFPHRLRPAEAHFILNGRNIPFVSHEKYLSVTFDRRVTWRLHIEVTEAKAFRAFIRMYSPFKSEHLNVNNNVMHLGVTYNRRMIWRYHICRKDCSQGFPNIHKDLFHNQKCVFKGKY
jgi:hypothetical protein